MIFVQQIDDVSNQLMGVKQLRQYLCNDVQTIDFTVVEKLVFVLANALLSPNEQLLSDAAWYI
jgi:hypothetical protein